MASNADLLPGQAPQLNESFAGNTTRERLPNKAETKAEKKKRRREKHKITKRTKPVLSQRSQVKQAINKAANLRRQRLQQILDTKDKMGLTKLGADQLNNLFGKKASKAPMPAMDEMDPSAQRVLAPIVAQEYEELMAWTAEVNLGQVPKEKKEESGMGTKLGEKKEDLEGQEEMEMRDSDEEWEEESEEENYDEGPEPVTP